MCLDEHLRQPDQNLTIEHGLGQRLNRSRVPMHSVFLRPCEADSWAADLADQQFGTAHTDSKQTCPYSICNGVVGFLRYTYTDHPVYWIFPA